MAILNNKLILAVVVKVAEDAELASKCIRLID